jgi:hypothetical protein
MINAKELDKKVPFEELIYSKWKKY